jgi:hypothetical protein
MPLAAAGFRKQIRESRTRAREREIRGITGEEENGTAGASTRSNLVLQKGTVKDTQNPNPKP